ncbi:MAG: hypothetical protein M1826_000367 [Phylliscum demangeonii]|nr:MAG: hypothetical protein M1826_000367 [Phylliscum demangeonii]
MLPLVAGVGLGLVALVSAGPARTYTGMPTVDLGYTVQQATFFDDTNQYYNFSNIRYGAPPVGALRWAAPAPPAVDRSTVQTGAVDRICHQAYPAWLLVEAAFVPAYLTNNASAMQAATAQAPPSASDLGPPDPRETEDCLFLDVVVPKAVFDGRRAAGGRGPGAGAGAPVMVWIHDGGYVFGSKTGSGTGSGNPVGLLARAQSGPAGNIIFVAINYRLGAFGWLGGANVTRAGGIANAGLRDQRLALEWVKRNIGLFGGDAGRVTIFGESAGAGSIMHQMTAYGGRGGPSPFQKVIAQSPGWQPVTRLPQQDRQLANFLATLGAAGVDDARTKPEAAVAAANAAMVGWAPYGTFGFNPAVDGTFVPDLPGKLLLRGAFDKTLQVMVGHNTDEGLIFSSPYIRDDAGYTTYIRQSFPAASAAVVDYIAHTMYPPVFDGSRGYRDQIQRTALTIKEAVFACNTNYVARAYGGRSYNYLFSVPPALHGFDLPYTFYDGPNPMVVADDPVALALQHYITAFAESGSPNEPGVVPVFNVYGPWAQVQSLGVGGIKQIGDDVANKRCLWWQQAVYA